MTRAAHLLWDRAVCVVCMRRRCAGYLFCRTCARSYDRQVARDETIAALIIWCAKRARREALRKR
jgi:hypothetical protein